MKVQLVAVWFREKKSLLSSLHSNLCFMETSTTFYPVMAHHQAKEITSLKCGTWKIDCGLSDFHWLFINRLVCQIFLVNLKACLACWILSEAFITYFWNNYTSFTPFFLKNRQQLHFSCENFDFFSDLSVFHLKLMKESKTEITAFKY